VACSFVRPNPIWVLCVWKLKKKKCMQKHSIHRTRKQSNQKHCIGNF